ncbi:MAG: LPS assembly protein LptD [Syntrophales bacterium]|nr:LPS assembly protein LptD [Syntrophales bacterium]MDY0043150.1 LPS assembly protein LptD [Syntrophales bacterium]
MINQLKRYFRWIIFVVFFFQASPLLAQQQRMAAGPFDIDAESLSFDRESETYKAEGDVNISFEGGFLKADQVSFDRRSQEAQAEGNVVFKYDMDVIEGERGQFNVGQKTGAVKNGKLFIEKNHLYLKGNKIEKTGIATYLLKEGSVTTCDGESPDWKITAEKIEVTIDGYGTINQGFFKVKDLPLLYVPYMIFPAKKTRQSGFLYPRIAYSSDKLGWDMGIPFYWAISEKTDATFYQRYMDKRGFQEGAELRYYLGEMSFGTFYGDYLKDNFEINGTGETGELFRNWEGDHNRWSYYWDHETRFKSGLYLRANIKKVSDNWYFKDFGSHNYYLDHYSIAEHERFSRVAFYGDEALASMDSTVRLVKDWNYFNMTALMQYTDNFQSYSNDETLQRYPEITITGIEQPVFDTPFHFAMDSTWGYYYRTTGQRGYLLDVYPVISLPLNFGSYLAFTPEIGIRETAWDSKDTSGFTSPGNSTREAYHIAATLDSEIQRIFNIGGRTIDKIRHGIRPEVIYRYVPQLDEMDRPNFVEAMAEENRITYALTNTLTARLKDEGTDMVAYREFLHLRLSQSFDINEAKNNIDPITYERRPFSDIQMELDFSPFDYFAADIDTLFSVNSGEWRQINGALTMADRRGDSAVIQYRYTQNVLEELNVYLKAQATKRINLSYVLRRNQLDERDLETTYGVVYQKQCWQVALQYTNSYDDRGYMCVFSLYGLGNVGSFSGG